MYLAQWLPSHQRGLAFGTLLSATAIADAVGGPFTTWLMTFSAFGLKGWQTMYIVQEILTIGIGAAALFQLPRYIADAKWLTQEKAWLQGRLDDERV